MNQLTIFLFLIAGVSLHAQKKQIDHTVYDEWKSIKSQQISHNGNFVTFEVNPHKGDGNLFLVNTADYNEKTFFKGKNASIAENEEVFVFLISPGYDTLRSLELKKVKKEKWVGDSLGIFFTKRDSLLIIPDIKSFKVSKENTYIAWLSNQNAKVFKTTKKCLKKKTEEVKIESNGKELVIYNYTNRDTIRKGNVVEYLFSDDGNWLVYSTHIKENKKDVSELVLVNLQTKASTKTSGYSEVGRFSFDENSRQFAFLASSDTAKNKAFQLYYWDLKNNPARIVDEDHSDLPKELCAGNGRTPSFSKDGSRIFFGIKALPEPELKDTLLESEKAKLDVWHYKDKRLQPQQLLGRKRDLDRNYLAMYDISTKSLIQIENDTLFAEFPKEGNQRYVLVSSKEQHEWSYTWVYPWPRDYYILDLNTRDYKLVAANVSYSQGNSPSGKYMVYFDNEKEQYRLIDNETAENFCISCGTQGKVNWLEDVNGQPHDAPPYGIAGYTKDEKSLLLHSEFDIWEFDLSGKGIYCLTNKLGEQFNTVLRVINRDKDSLYIDKSRMFIHGTDQTSKDERIYQLEESIRRNDLVQWLDTEHRITGIQFAAKGEAVIYQKMNVRDFPDVYANTLTFDKEQKISHANPQQVEFIWPTVELIRWKAYDGTELEGLIYKPENFDPNKSYPLMVYFYELYADRKHVHYIPKPTASIIFATEYASAGYVVFMPDIRYKPGYPARGAYNCIMSGTDDVLRRYPNIDSTRMGLQGQSWGGYQTAQLITMTNRYKAAMAGAPVSNMFSAYGGIRWGSGLNRQFQYERSQSRIGKTIWEAPELYVENSPLFGLPKVETPLLIMHNDKDGAVPWYQGIELFVGLRRLDKPVWMLNYNDDDHNLMQDANRRDLSIRMRQFFDHYLMGAPAPIWLIEGVPATLKGKDYRLELMDVKE
jgi:dipeptidyl aminopeptidase/acylaminoacyl peptidase